MKTATLLLFALTVLARGADDASVPPQAALDAIGAEDLLKHIKVLASDEYEGRAPGTKGEELTVKYLTEQFKALGLKARQPERHLHAGGSAGRHHDRRRPRASR